MLFVFFQTPKRTSQVHMQNNQVDIALVQQNIHWENPDLNRQHIAHLLNQMTQKPQLIILPEMFTSGFSMNPQKIAEPHEGLTLRWMQEKASALSSAMVGSLAIQDKDRFYNRLYFVFPSGAYVWYDKRHLFTLAGEHQVYSAGSKPVVVDYLGWKWCLQVCYDLRFPVFSRNTSTYDAIIYVANWPQPRIHAWDALLQARAIENMAYCIGVNRVGVDANGHAYPGHSQAWDALGNAILPKQTQEGIYFVTLEANILQEMRSKFPFLKDQDAFTLNDVAK